MNLLSEAAVALVHGPKVRRERADVRDRVGTKIDRFRERLGTRRDDFTYTLSYANRRRTEIARAHISEPKLLLLDEPTAGMNQSETAEVLEQLQYLKAQGHTILLVEHKIELVTALSDRVIAMDGGRIIAQGEPDEVRRAPQVVEAYLSKHRELHTTTSARHSGMLGKQNAIEHGQLADAEREGCEHRARSVACAWQAGIAHTGRRQRVLRLGIHALQDVSISVPKGSIVSLLGGNASGKSTTMKTILGLNQVKSGTITFADRDITRVPTRRRVLDGIAAVPEARRIFRR